jgi:hypothetical protein
MVALNVDSTRRARLTAVVLSVLAVTWRSEYPRLPLRGRGRALLLYEGYNTEESDLQEERQQEELARGMGKAPS